MEPYVNDIIRRAWHVALVKGSSTGISVIWLDLGVLMLGFVCSVAIGWFSEGRNLQALKVAAKSWKSFASTAIAFLIAWAVLFAYSIVCVAYSDHQKLIGASQKKCPASLVPIPAPVPPPVLQHARRTYPTTRQTITQHGNNNQSNQFVISGKQTTNGPESPIINGSNNLQSAPPTSTKPQKQ